MESLKTLNSSILSLIILVFIYYNANNRIEKVFTSHKIFIALIQSNMALIVIDIFSWIFNEHIGMYNVLGNKLFNLLLFVIEPLVGILWTFYIYYQVGNNEKRIKTVKYILLTSFCVNGILSFISLKTGWFFYVNSKNIYSRGSLYFIHIAYCYIILLYSMYYIFKNRKIIEKRYYYSMLLFMLPITIGASLQILFYGLSFAWSGMMVSILIIYFNIQDKGLNTDYLTGINNRRQLDSYLKFKIKNGTADKSFAAILIDLDGFKKINDTFGHDIGDEALKATARIIKDSLRRDDFVARYGGDEFFIIMDNDSTSMVEIAIKRLKENVESFNNYSSNVYKLSFSIGYAVYDYKTKMKSDDFFKYVDSLMYNDKDQKNSFIN